MKKYLISIVFILIPFISFSQTTIQMEEYGGVYRIPCTVNGAKMKLIFDTGASNVCLSQSIAEYLLDNDYISTSDFISTGQSVVADGRIVDHLKINLRDIEIAGLHLMDVPAVVVFEQQAPLLLGQSAIQKLGKVTLNGNRLIIGSFDIDSVDGNMNRNEVYELSEDECNNLLQEAIMLYYNDCFSDANEMLQQLYNVDYLSSKGIFKLAHSYMLMGDYSVALKYFFEIEGDYLNEMNNDLPDMYRLIAVCYERLAQERDYIKYMKIAISKCKNIFTKCEYRRLYSFSLLDINKYDAFREFDSMIKEYCNYLGIKPTDCWNKGYKDEFLAKAYYDRSLYDVDNYDDYDKYKIISAAWGDKKAIERCKKYEINYTKKPYKYEY